MLQGPGEQTKERHTPCVCLSYLAAHILFRFTHQRSYAVSLPLASLRDRSPPLHYLISFSCEPHLTSPSSLLHMPDILSRVQTMHFSSMRFS